VTWFHMVDEHCALFSAGGAEWRAARREACGSPSTGTPTSSWCWCSTLQAPATCSSCTSRAPRRGGRRCRATGGRCGSSPEAPRTRWARRSRSAPSSATAAQWCPPTPPRATGSSGRPSKEATNSAPVKSLPVLYVY
jgi:hypothetical protein